MAREPLMWAVDDEDDGDPWFLVATSEAYDYDRTEPLSFRAPSLEDLANYCDQRAEIMNAHDFVGSHRVLGALLFRRFGRRVAGEIMLEIAEYGGIPDLVGGWNDDAAFEEFGFTHTWADWSYPEGETWPERQ